MEPCNTVTLFLSHHFQNSTCIPDAPPTTSTRHSVISASPMTAFTSPGKSIKAHLCSHCCHSKHILGPKNTVKKMILFISIKMQDWTWFIPSLQNSKIKSIHLRIIYNSQFTYQHVFFLEKKLTLSWGKHAKHTIKPWSCESPTDLQYHWVFLNENKPKTKQNRNSDACHWGTIMRYNEDLPLGKRVQCLNVAFQRKQDPAVALLLLPWGML